MKLGKRAAKHDARTLRLVRYVRAMPPPPQVVDWTAKMSFPCGSMLNNQLGDCTCAGMGHALQLWTANASSEVTLPDNCILLAYQAACGYDPNDPATDRGGVEIEVLNYWRSNGIGPAGHRIIAYTAVNVLNHQEVMQALQLFGCLYTGVTLPVSAEAQVGQTWDVDSTPAGNPGSWGGHCVIICQADPQGLTCITWGQKQRLTWAFWDRYFDEAFACLSPDWIEASQLSPSGFDLARLQSDLEFVTA